jgi:hypothetical protein
MASPILIDEAAIGLLDGLLMQVLIHKEIT